MRLVTGATRCRYASASHIAGKAAVLRALVHLLESWRRFSQSDFRCRRTPPFLHRIDQEGFGPRTFFDACWLAILVPSPQPSSLLDGEISRLLFENGATLRPFARLRPRPAVANTPIAVARSALLSAISPPLDASCHEASSWRVTHVLQGKRHCVDAFAMA